jgi:hypothetical protein
MDGSQYGDLVLLSDSGGGLERGIMDARQMDLAGGSHAGINARMLLSQRTHSDHGNIKERGHADQNAEWGAQNAK